jgi:hypothetical protein
MREGHIEQPVAGRGYSGLVSVSLTFAMLLRRNGLKTILALLALGPLGPLAYGCGSEDDSAASCEGGECLTGSGTLAVGEPCEETRECIPGSVCFNKYCVGAGNLRVSLAFTVDADFDLHVLTPGDIEIYFSEPSANGGTLDVDQCISSCGTEPHAENIVFDDTALSGEYEVWVVNFGGRAAGDFSIEVAGDVSASFQGSLPAGTTDSFDYPESMHYTFTL